ncbi:MAG: histidine kinase, partial [Cyclobacteriaceae bacterium]|nr:histidine kinase [Cyclobacteriaceae bacterium]
MFFCPGCPLTLSGILKNWFFAGSLFYILYKGNWEVGRRLDIHFPWLYYPLKRFTYGIIGALVYTTVTLLFVGILANRLFDVSFGSNEMLPLYFANGFAVLVFCFVIARQYLLSWQELALREEKIKNELLSARYDSLKNQVNPHFLFNSLNTISSLIREDPDLAERFVKQLSIVYRYVLQTRTREAVTLAEELDMLDSFIFLQKIRYDNSLLVDIDLKEGSKSKLVLPLVLQMLMENALKHNTISSEQPLTLTINEEDDFIVVTNNLQPKNVLRNESSKVGLSNIKSRYALLTNSEVTVEKTKEAFIVKVPLLKLMKNESTDR